MTENLIGNEIKESKEIEEKNERSSFKNLEASSSPKARALETNENEEFYEEDEENEMDDELQEGEEDEYEN